MGVRSWPVSWRLRRTRTGRDTIRSLFRGCFSRQAARADVLVVIGVVLLVVDSGVVRDRQDCTPPSSASAAPVASPRGAPASVGSSRVPRHGTRAWPSAPTGRALTVRELGMASPELAAVYINHRLHPIANVRNLICPLDLDGHRRHITQRLSGELAHGTEQCLKAIANMRGLPC